MTSTSIPPPPGEKVSAPIGPANGAAANGAAEESPRSANRPYPQAAGSFLRVLRHREFALFWSGQTVSLVGTWMQQFAQGWVVTNLTTSALALGWVTFASSIPTLVLMPFGGVAADRMERRRILICTQVIMALMALLMGLLIAEHRLELWHVWSIALVLGIATAYDLPAYQSFYPQLIEREDLAQAISLNQATFHGSRIVGPALAAVCVAAWGMAAAFFANAASFVAVIGCLLGIRARPPAAGAGRGGSTFQFMGEGVAYVRQRPGLQSLLGLTGLTSFFIFPNMAVLMPFYAQHVLHVGTGGLGALMTSSGAGAMAGSMLLLAIPRGWRVPWIALSLVLITATLTALAWSQRLSVSVAAVTCQSFGISSSLGLASVMVQELVPDALRGRVMSLYTLMFTGIIPFAALLITRAADIVGMRHELQGSAILYALCGVTLMFQLPKAHAEQMAPGPEAEGLPELVPAATAD